LFTSTEFKNDATSTSFPNPAKRTLSSSLVKKPSLFTSAASNCSFSYFTYSEVSFFSK
jgi:hypothetical protein